MANFEEGALTASRFRRGFGPVNDGLSGVSFSLVTAIAVVPCDPTVPNVI